MKAQNSKRPSDLSDMLWCVTPRAGPTCNDILQEQKVLELAPCSDQDCSPGQVRSLVPVPLVSDPSPTPIVTVCRAGYYRQGQLVFVERGGIPCLMSCMKWHIGQATS